MPQAACGLFSGNRFFKTLDFQPGHQSGLPSRKVATKKFHIGGETAEVQEDPHESVVKYTFSKEKNPTNYISFTVNVETGDCTCISGHWSHPKVALSSNDPSAQSLRDMTLSAFLKKLKNVFSGKDFDALIRDTLHEFSCAKQLLSKPVGPAAPAL